MSLNFDWDEHNRSHIARHHVTAHEAEQVVLNDPVDITLQNDDGEERIVQVGATAKARILIVITTWREEKLRVITAYDAPKQLCKLYLSQKF